MNEKVSEFWDQVTASGRATCFVALRRLDPKERACSGPLEAHHVLRKQTLKRRLQYDFSPPYLEEKLWDPRNGLPVCREHHELLTKRSIIVAYDALPPEVVDFADDVGLKHLLEAECSRRT